MAQSIEFADVAMNKEPLLYGVFSEGMDSYLRELPREDCPYPSGSAERVAWLGGWDQTAHGKRYDIRHGGAMVQG